LDYMRQFVIPLSGLKAGNYDFAFDIDDTFFENFEYSEIGEGRVQVVCRLERQERMLIFQFHFTGLVTIACDRCGQDYQQPLYGETRLIVKFGSEHQEVSEEVLMVHEKEHEIDLSQFFYEYIHLLLPMKRVHGENTAGDSLCDPEITRFISEDKKPQADPRWEKLKQLKDNTNQEN